MNKIVHEHVAVEELPEDLRSGLPGDGRVTVTIELEEAQTNPRQKLFEMKERLDAYRKEHGIPDVTTEEAVARIRQLRDEWE